MAGKLKVILNTYGGRLKPEAKIAAVKQAMHAAGLEFDLDLTEYNDHAIELARQAVLADYQTVVAAGGDGTINQVVNGFFQASDQPPACLLGILPLGTANDLAYALSIPSDVTAACRQLAIGQPRTLDVGRVNGRYFINNSAVGLEPVVTMTQHRMRWLKGNIRYVVAALKVIFRAQSWEMRLEWDKGVFDGPVVLVSVGNSPRTGGAFFMTPRAEVDDGMLDFVYGAGMSRWRMLMLLPRLFNGSHLNSALVGYARTTKLRVTAAPATPIQADGEVFVEAAEEINYEIMAKAIRVIV